MTNEVSNKNLYLNSQIQSITGNSTSNNEVELLFDENNTVSNISAENALSDDEILNALNNAQDENIDEENAKDHTIEPSKQRIGDCWLMAGVNALSYSEKGKEVIQNALEYHDGYTVVHLITGDYTVTDEEYQSAQKNKTASTGDEDMAIIELAAQKALDDYDSWSSQLDEYKKLYFDTALNMTNKTSSIDGGYPNQIWYLLTGNFGVPTDKTEYKETVLERLEKDNNQNYAASASISTAEGKNVLTYSKEYEEFNTQDTTWYDITGIDGQKITTSTNHVVAIKKVTEDTVTIVDSNFPDKSITLSRKDFLNTYDRINFLVLSSKNIN